MAQELLYTSAPRGLKSGSRGFCTVEATAGMSPALVTVLEGLSGYRHVATPGDPANPVVYSHVTLSIGGRRCSVVSRVADAGADYTGRTNKLAHHLALDAAERPKGGPAWLARQPNVLRTRFDGEPRTLPPRTAPQGDRSPAVCKAWQAATGDAGWAGVLAEAFLADPKRPAYLVVPAGLDLLPLFEEAIALLPPDRRWDATFTTCYTSLPQNVTCLWKTVLAGSKEAHESRRFVQALRIDLTQPLGPATGGSLVEAARTGRMPAVIPPATPRQTPAAAVIARPIGATTALDDAPLDVMPAAPQRRPDQFLIEPLERPPAMRRGSRWKVGALTAAAVLCLAVIALPFALGLLEVSRPGIENAESIARTVAGQPDSPSVADPRAPQTAPVVEQNAPFAKPNADVAQTTPDNLPAAPTAAENDDRQSADMPDIQIHRESGFGTTEKPFPAMTAPIPDMNDDGAVKDAGSETPAPAPESAPQLHRVALLAGGEKRKTYIFPEGLTFNEQDVPSVDLVLWLPTWVDDSQYRLEERDDNVAITSRGTAGTVDVCTVGTGRNGMGLDYTVQFHVKANKDEVSELLKWCVLSVTHKTQPNSPASGQYCFHSIQTASQFADGHLDWPTPRYNGASLPHFSFQKLELFISNRRAAVPIDGQMFDLSKVKAAISAESNSLSEVFIDELQLALSLASTEQGDAVCLDWKVDKGWELAQNAYRSKADAVRTTLKDIRYYQNDSGAIDNGARDNAVAPLFNLDGAVAAHEDEFENVITSLEEYADLYRNSISNFETNGERRKQKLQVFNSAEGIGGKVTSAIADLRKLKADATKVEKLRDDIVNCTVVSARLTYDVVGPGGVTMQIPIVEIDRAD